MASQADLIQRRRGFFQELLKQYSVAVYRELPDGEPDFSATGILLRVADRVVLVSAGHALEEVPPVLIMKNGDVVRLTNPVATAKQTLPYGDPYTDVASVLLTPAETQVLDPLEMSFTSVLSPFDSKAPRSHYLALGMRVEDQLVDHAAQIFEHSVASVAATEVRRDFYDLCRLDRSRVLLIGASPSRFKGPKGAGGVPSFKGMSGCPVWRFSLREEYSIEHLPPLVGMLVGRPSHTKKAVTVVRVGLVIEHLGKRYPFLAPHLPPFARAI